MNTETNKLELPDEAIPPVNVFKQVFKLLGPYAIHLVWPVLLFAANWVSNLNDTMIRMEDHIEYLDQRVVELENQLHVVPSPPPAGK